jgi:hypothetical protein
MNPEKIKELAANVNNLLKLHHKQAQAIAELFKICLEYLDESKWPKYESYGSGLTAAKAAMIRRKERKQQLLAAIKGYIEMIEEREQSDEK